MCQYEVCNDHETTCILQESVTTRPGSFNGISTMEVQLFHTASRLKTKWMTSFVFWLVVATQLKNISQTRESSPIFGVNKQKWNILKPPFMGWSFFILNKKRIEAWHPKQPCWNGCFFFKFHMDWKHPSEASSFTRLFLGGSRLKAETKHSKWVNLANDETMETSDSVVFLHKPSAVFFLFNTLAWTNHQIRRF